MLAKRNISIQVLTVSLIIFAVRGLFPYATQLFVIVSIILLLITFLNINYSKLNLFQIKNLLVYFWPYLLISIIFIVSFTLSDFKPPVILKEILNIFVLVLFLASFYFIIQTKEDYKQLVSNFTQNYVNIFLFIVLYYFTNSIFFGEKHIIDRDLKFSESDNNMFALGILLALLLIINQLRNPINYKIKKYYFNILFLIYSIAILFLSSRRGIAALVILLIIVYLMSRKRKWIILRTNTKTIFICILIICFSAITFFALPGGKVRSYLINKITSKGIETELKISYGIHRYAVIIKPSLPFSSVHKYLWKTNGKIDLIQGLIRKNNLNAAFENLTEKNYITSFEKYAEAYQLSNNDYDFIKELPLTLKNGPDTLINGGSFPLLPYYATSGNITFIDQYRPVNSQNSWYYHAEEQKINSQIQMGFVFKKTNSNNNIVIRGQFPAISGGMYELSFFCHKDNLIIPKNYVAYSDFDTINIKVLNSKMDSVDQYFVKVTEIIIVESNTTNILNLFLTANDNEKNSYWISDIEWKLMGKELHFSSKFNLKDYKNAKNFYNTRINRAAFIASDFNEKKELYNLQNKKLEGNTEIKNFNEILIKKFKNQELTIYEYSNEFSKPINLNDSVVFIINENQKWLRAQVKFLATQGSSFKINFDIITKKGYPYYYFDSDCKNNFFSYEIVDQQTIKVDSNRFKISMKCEVIENFGLDAKLYLGVSEGFKDDSVIVDNFSIEYYKIGEIEKPSMYQNLLATKYVKELNENIKVLKSHEKYKNFIDEMDIGGSDSTTNYLIGARLNRIKFALNVFKSYNTQEKLLGKGFLYGELFSWRFKSKNRTSDSFDSPHNPFISALLYSGIIGFIFFALFVSFSVYYYVIYYDQIKILFILYLVIWSFAFFSGKSFFSFPSLIVFSIFPFYYSYLVNLFKN